MDFSAQRTLLQSATVRNTDPRPLFGDLRDRNHESNPSRVMPTRSRMRSTSARSSVFVYAMICRIAKYIDDSIDLIDYSGTWKYRPQVH